MPRNFLSSILILLATLSISLRPSHACTLWGAAGEIASGGTMLSKNRDWRPDHVQVLKMRRATNAFAYFGLYAEGNDAPGLKQGVNEKGLAAMTATAGAIPKKIRDAQTGRSGLMSTLLMNYATCDEIIADEKKLFSNRKPVFMLISDRKKIIVLEVGLNGRYAFRVVDSGTVAHSNHYLEDSMQEFNLSSSTGSRTRFGRVTDLLNARAEPFDLDSFADISRDKNDGPHNSLWRIGGGTNSCTLSSWIVQTPAQGAPKLRVLIANPGQPEQLHNFVLDEKFWSETANATAFQPTSCEGVYPGHLQGVCTDDAGSIFWSWTDALVKTDASGRVLKKAKAANHHGDLCFHNGKIFVAVNLGKFNRPAGEADSWVYVYDAATLKELARHAVPELVHGAGGIGYHDGKFIVVGGLPEGVSENYLYEYDTHFSFRKRHVLSSGYTRMGIQTATFANGAWWFGCYGTPPVLLRADKNFQFNGKWEFDAALGIVNIGNDRFLLGRNTGNKSTGYSGRVIAARLNEKNELVLE